MEVTLTEMQAEKIAVAWIKARQNDPNGYKRVLMPLFDEAHFASWSWIDALRFIVRRCSQKYFVDKKTLLEDL